MNPGNVIIQDVKLIKMDEDKIKCWNTKWFNKGIFIILVFIGILYSIYYVYYITDIFTPIFIVIFIFCCVILYLSFNLMFSSNDNTNNFDWTDWEEDE